MATESGSRTAGSAVPELAHLLRQIVIHGRTSGPLFLRMRLMNASSNLRSPPLLACTRARLGAEVRRRVEEARHGASRVLTRAEEARVQADVWRDAGAIDAERVRTTFIRTCRGIGIEASCPKSWRHTFATLLQQANVELLVRQETLGHKSASADRSPLGMTAHYTHTTPDLQRSEIARALALRPTSLQLAREFVARHAAKDSASVTSPESTPVATNNVNVTLTRAARRPNLS
jgi:integrase